MARKSKVAFDQLTPDEKAIAFMCFRAVASGMFGSRNEIPTIVGAREDVVDMLANAYPDINHVFDLIEQESDDEDEVEQAIRGCLVYSACVIYSNHNARSKFFSVDKAAIKKVLYRWNELNGQGDLNQDSQHLFTPD